MPYQVMWEPRGVYTRYYGSVTGADMLGNIEDVCRDDRFERHRYHILDFSDAIEFSATEKEMLVNSGVLVGAAFANHQVMVAAVSDQAGTSRGLRFVYLASSAATASDALRNRSAFPTTDTEDRLIASAAIIGLSSHPNAG